jgi:hypothetical protein
MHDNISVSIQQTLSSSIACVNLHSCLLVPAAVSAALAACLAPGQCISCYLLRLLQLLLVLCLLLLAGLPRVVLHPHHLRVAAAPPRLAPSAGDEPQAVHCAWHPCCME